MNKIDAKLKIKQINQSEKKNKEKPILNVPMAISGNEEGINSNKFSIGNKEGINPNKFNIGNDVVWAVNNYENGNNNNPAWRKRLNGTYSSGLGFGKIKNKNGDYYILENAKRQNGSDVFNLGTVRVKKNQVNKGKVTNNFNSLFSNSSESNSSENRSLYNMHPNESNVNVINPMVGETPVNQTIKAGDIISWNHKAKNGSTERITGEVTGIKKNKNIITYNVKGPSGPTRIRSTDHNIKLNQKAEW